MVNSSRRLRTSSFSGHPCVLAPVADRRAGFFRQAVCDALRDLLAHFHVHLCRLGNLGLIYPRANNSISLHARGSVDPEIARAAHLHNTSGSCAAGIGLPGGEIRGPVPEPRRPRAEARSAAPPPIALRDAVESSGSGGSGRGTSAVMLPSILHCCLSRRTTVQTSGCVLDP